MTEQTESARVECLENLVIHLGMGWETDEHVERAQKLIKDFWEDDTRPRPKFALWQSVSKPKGYSFDGVVVSRFYTMRGGLRYVIEHARVAGRLHIFNEDQLVPRPLA